MDGLTRLLSGGNLYRKLSTCSGDETVVGGVLSQRSMHSMQPCYSVIRRIRRMDTRTHRRGDQEKRRQKRVRSSRHLVPMW